MWIGNPHLIQKVRFQRTEKPSLSAFQPAFSGFLVSVVHLQHGNGQVHRQSVKFNNRFLNHAIG
jgi:hypothetical protein